MKISAFLICLSLVCCGPSVKAQGLTPSTVRQVFNLQKGDSLEYHVWNVVSCGPNCNYYFLKIVDSVSQSLTQDTLSIFFVTLLLHFDIDSTGLNIVCGQCSEYFTWADICPVAVSQWSFTYLDSSIIFLLGTSYGTIPSSQTAAMYDSIYRDSLAYNGSKQNFYSGTVGGFDGTTEVYADSLGIVYKAENVELSTNNREQLIYYHKANGSSWGTPYINTGIANIDAYQISVHPNPAEDKFIVHSDLYQGLRFELLDILSKQVMNLELTSKETEVNRSGPPSGIYFWQVTDGVNVIKTGKLIME